MLSVVLTILKIIGIVLLCILATVLLIVFMVLFVPIRYKIVLDKSNTEVSSFSVKGKVTYLLHLLNVHFAYPSDDLYYVRISFFRIFPKKEKIRKSKQENTQNIESVVEDNNSVVELPNENSTESKSDWATIDYEEPPKGEPSLDEVTKVDCVEVDHLQVDEQVLEKTEDDQHDENKEKPGIRDFIKKIIDIVSNIKLTVKKVYDKILDIRNNIEYYCNIINSKVFKDAFKLCKKELFKILKIILPKKIKGYARFGSDDPTTCAQIYGGYVVLRPLLGKHFDMKIDYQNDILEGHIELAGYICICSLLFIGVKLFFNKNIRKLIKLFKKESK